MSELRNQRDSRDLLQGIGEVNALRAATEAAGALPSAEVQARRVARLQEIVLASIVGHDGEPVETKVGIWIEIRKSRDLLEQLLQGYWPEMVERLIARTRQQISAKYESAEPKRPIERRAAVVVRNLDQLELENRQRRADEDLTIKSQEAEERYQKWRRTHIGSLTVNNMPVWDVTAITLRSAAVRGVRQWHAIRLLTDGVPDDGHPLHYHRTPEDAEAAWRRSVEETTDGPPAP